MNNTIGPGDRVKIATRDGNDGRTGTVIGEGRAGLRRVKMDDEDRVILWPWYSLARGAGPVPLSPGIKARLHAPLATQPWDGLPVTLLAPAHVAGAILWFCRFASPADAARYGGPVPSGVGNECRVVEAEHLAPEPLFRDGPRPDSSAPLSPRLIPPLTPPLAAATPPAPPVQRYRLTTIYRAGDEATSIVAGEELGAVVAALRAAGLEYRYAVA